MRDFPQSRFRDTTDLVEWNRKSTIEEKNMHTHAYVNFTLSIMAFYVIQQCMKFAVYSFLLPSQNSKIKYYTTTYPRNPAAKTHRKRRKKSGEREGS